MIKEIINEATKATIATQVLLDLPEWFGIPESTKDYIEKSQAMPFFAKYDKDQAIGFVSLKETSPYTVEIYCMGVLKSYHRIGYGHALLEVAKEYAIKHGYKLMQVKTVKEGKYAIYDKTNAFYKALGFYELEVFPTLWDEHNPCQIFVKSI